MMKIKQKKMKKIVNVWCGGIDKSCRRGSKSLAGSVYITLYISCNTVVSTYAKIFMKVYVCGPLASFLFS